MDDLILKLSSPPVKNVCSFYRWFNDLTDKEQESVRAALVNPQWSGEKLADVFKEHGAAFGSESVIRHRKGKCATCGPI